ncbi:MAG: DUF3494 domain-containing protein [Lewinellaceae bacterium]|nr:DUF3494 domain-containing protein [Lewinellaceae bacterium]
MKSIILLFVSVALSLFSTTPMFAQSPPLGTTANFALFTAVGAFNNVGTSAITGDIGTNVGAFSGFPPGVVIGQIHVADIVSAQAATDVSIAYSYLSGLTCGSVLSTTLGGGQILTPNIYCMGAASSLNGNLILDAQGDPTAMFIFQIDGALETSTFSSVTLINSANLCNVYWQINGAFSLADGSAFVGTVIANGAISLAIGATLDGRALSTGGAISTSDNVVTNNLCLVPTITCPNAVTISCNNQVPVPNTNSVTVTVTCPGDYTVLYLGDAISNQICDNRYSIQRTYQVTDACGSTAICSQTITVNDQTPPTVSCLANVNVSCAADVPAPAPNSVTASDLCGGGVTVVHVSDVINAQTCANRYTITRTYRATDLCGNSATCAQTITVNDQTPPTVSCLANVNISCAADVPAPAPNSVTASDLCGGGVIVVHVSDVINAQTCVNRYTITRTYRATDLCGNSADCVQIITVNDQTPPTVSCPVNVNVSCAADVPAPAPNSVTASDLCGGGVIVVHVSDVFNAQTCANRYTITRTYHATDLCGNSATCAQTITVNDQTPPVIPCLANVNVSCAADVPAPALNSVTASDLCGGGVTVVHVSDVINAQTCVNRYTITRTYRATDLCGNSATCAQTITVNDLTPPVISCLANVNVSCAADVPAPAPNSVTASDLCGGGVIVVHVSDVINAQTCVNRYTITRTYRATDLCGNSADCVQIITVNDQTPPTVSCLANVNVSCAADVPAPAPNSVTASDLCGGGVIVVHVSDVINAQTCANRYTITRT